MMLKVIVAALLGLACSLIAIADALPQYYPPAPYYQGFYPPGNQGFYPPGNQGFYPPGNQGLYNNGGSQVRVNIRRGVAVPC